VNGTIDYPASSRPNPSRGNLISKPSGKKRLMFHRREKISFGTRPIIRARNRYDGPLALTAQDGMTRQIWACDLASATDAVATLAWLPHSIASIRQAHVAN